MKRATHVQGQGDVVYRQFQCLNHTCERVLVVPEDAVGSDFEIPCPTCGFQHRAAAQESFFDYDVIDLRSKEVLDKGTFSVPHAAHVRDYSQRVKYCLYCNALRPLHDFAHHRGKYKGSGKPRRKSGRQGECSLCKDLYNAVKNKTRLAEQHREAADTRRMMLAVSGEASGPKLDLVALYRTFEGRCFNCQRDLENRNGGPNGYRVDHTLPVYYLWPLNAGPTLLCVDCNSEKAEKWPSAFYKDDRNLRALAVRTGLAYELLAGPPRYNPDAVAALRDGIDAFLVQWIPYPDRIRDLRARVLAGAGVDIFERATHVPPALLADDVKTARTRTRAAKRASAPGGSARKSAES